MSFFPLIPSYYFLKFLTILLFNTKDFHSERSYTNQLILLTFGQISQDQKQKEMSDSNGSNKLKLFSLLTLKFFIQTDNKKKHSLHQFQNYILNKQKCYLHHQVE